MTPIVAFFNQKGGTAKTTSTLNIGAALVERGRRVLAMDLDPQASLTMALGRRCNARSTCRSTICLPMSDCRCRRSCWHDGDRQAGSCSESSGSRRGRARAAERPRAGAAPRREAAVGSAAALRLRPHRQPSGAEHPEYQHPGGGVVPGHSDRATSTLADGAAPAV